MKLSPLDYIKEDNTLDLEKLAADLGIPLEELQQAEECIGITGDLINTYTRQKAES